MEALQNRAELLLLKCRKELYFGKVDELKKKCRKEQDDVLCMEGSLFSKLRRDYEERLTEEKKEALRTDLELKLVEKELMELERQISELENVSSIYNVEELNDAEKELHGWCEMMESGWTTGGALERKLKELEHLEKLCRSIIVEKIPLGEELMRKVRMHRFQLAEKDIFGFERQE